MITPQEISTTDVDLARRILVLARFIAPGIDLIPEGEDRLTVIAILKNVVAEVPAPGARRVSSRSRNGTSISYRDIGGAFSDDDRLSLRSLVASVPAGLPIGSFPAARPIAREWAEGEYS
ncbi:hypothetical protein E3T37_03595 [Cryobacterium sp. TMT2-10]|uniref:hypothetical protein n=1 Tax=Cryobacterium sp. TMT2-10 TaxID=1259244 RepID=UPI00106C58FE|nr:hypothetical protein [Cryobacterium sp. TMT2-10]TFD41748.1 hypothetical protein E3T37_03595 [Cryobacterium sp. TMT2-10]